MKATSIGVAKQTASQPDLPKLGDARRYDIYALAHKALRAAMSATLNAVGRLDTDDAHDLRAVLADAKELLALCRSHLEKENEFLHPAIEARSPGSSTQIAHDHEAHERSLSSLQNAIDVIECADDAAGRASAATILYRELAMFVADNLLHMQVEETANNAALWAHYTDDELKELHRRLVTSVAPEAHALLMRHLLPAVTRRERALVLGGMKREMPATIFSAALSRFQTHLPERDWNKLMADLAGC